MSEKQDNENIRISQVLAGALAAVTAALLGSTMGVAGTVVGAGLASIVSTVGGAIYLRSIQRTKESVRTVHAKVVGRSGDTTVLVTAENPESGEREAGETVAASVDAADSSGDPSAESSVDVEPESSQRDRRRLNWPVLVAGSVLAFVVGMLAITGVEWMRGGPLSGGEGTTFGSIVQPRHDTGDTQDERSPSTPSTQPSGEPTVSDAPPPSTTSTTAPSTRSTPPSEPSTPSSTTPPSTTSSTPSVAPTAPGGTIPPSN